MRHLMLFFGLVSFAGLDIVFVSYSDTPTAALVFTLLSFALLLLLSGSAGNLAVELGNESQPLGPPVGNGLTGLAGRPLLASVIPVALLLVAVFIRDLDDPLAPNETAQLGSTFAVFWLMMALALVGAALGFLRPRTGPLEAVIAGGLVVLAQGVISWVKVDATWDAIQLALYTWMIWVSICLIGAWVGIVLRQVSSRTPPDALEPSPEYIPETE